MLSYTHTDTYIHTYIAKDGQTCITVPHTHTCIHNHTHAQAMIKKTPEGRFQQFLFNK